MRVAKEDYRFTLFLATLFHVVLFSTLFFTWRHPSKLLSLASPSSVPIIYATAVTVSQWPSTREQKKIKSVHPPEKKMIKPELLKKSPVSLPLKEKKLPKNPIHPSNSVTSVVKKTASSELTPDKNKPRQINQKRVKKEHPRLAKSSLKSLHIAQKNVQQLLQQAVSTTIQNQAMAAAARNTIITEKYRHLILQSIAQQWIIPPEIDKHLETKLAIHLARDGIVLNVLILKSSGNSVLDLSAQTAVYKASPLPVPKEDSLFNHFRQINLTLRPEGVLAQ